MKKIIKIKYFPKVLFLLFVWFLPTAHVSALDFSFVPGDTTISVTVTTIQTGTLVELDINTDIMGELEWELFSTNTIPSGLFLSVPNGVTTDSVDLSAIGSFSPTSGNPYSFVVVATDSGRPDDEEMVFNVSVTIRNPVSVVLVLDNSGSMAYRPESTGGGALPPDLESRWGILKANVSAFLNGFQPLAKAGDQIGIVYFSTDVITTPNSSMLLDATLESSITALNDDLGNATLNPPPLSGYTSIGDGMQRSKLVLAGAPAVNSKYVLLVTDGQQNAPLMIPNGGPINTLETLDGEKFIDINDTAKVCIIATEEASFYGAAPNLFHNIASSTGGDAYFKDSSTEVSESFDNCLQSFLSDSSPQLVAEGEEIVVDNLKSLSFDINKHVSNLQFKVVNKNKNHPPIIRILKDGVAIEESSNIRMQSGSLYTLFSIDLPAQVNGTTINSAGSWTLEVQRADTFYYSVMADDHLMDVDFNLGAKSFTVGDKIRPTVNLSYKGQPIENASVKLQFKIPGEDIADLVARTDLNIDPVSDLEAGSAGFQKLLQLLKNAEFFNAIKSRTDGIALSHQGNGVYQTSQPIPAALKGLYEFKFFVEGNSPEIGQYTRTRELHTQVSPPTPDPNVSVAEFNLVQPNSSTFEFTYTPAYSYGGVPRLYGPTYEQNIRLEGVNVNSIVDNLDGSYTINGNGRLTDNVTLQFGPHQLYSGSLRNIDRIGADSLRTGNFGLFVGGGSVDGQGVGTIGLEYLFKLASIGNVNLLVGPYGNGMYFFSEPNNIGLAGGGLAGIDVKSSSRFWFRAFGKYGQANFNISDEVGITFLNEWDPVAGGGIVLGRAGAKVNIGLKAEYNQILEGTNDGKNFFLIGLTLGF